MSFVAIIPARLASSRLPEKPLADIAGKPMIVRVAERALQSGASAVHVATDDHRIASVVHQHGLSALMTAASHSSGTERLAEAVDLLSLADDVAVVNVQGDEPLIDPALIDAVAAMLRADTSLPMTTACHAIDQTAELFNPHVVKVVLNQQSHAMYFSRAPIPYARDAFIASDFSSKQAAPSGLPVYRHIGIYGYRAGFLRTYRDLAPCALEQFEALEQLRVLWHGYSIGVAVVAAAPAAGVDTPEDLARVREQWPLLSGLPTS